MDLNFLKPGIHVCCHGLAFSSSVLFKSCSEPFKTYLSYSFSILLIHFAFLLYSFRFPNYTPLFCSICIVGMSSCILHWLVGRYFFHYFGMSCFVFIAWPCLGIFWVSILLPISCLLFCFGFSITTHPRVFPFHTKITCCRSFFTYPSSHISHQDFVFFFGFLKRLTFLTQTSFASV